MMKFCWVFFMSIIIAGFNNNTCAQIVIAQWNFDASSLMPSTGDGSGCNIGNTTTAWVSGNPSTGVAWNTSGYPAANVCSGTAGVQFNVSTEGYEDILLTWENRNSNTAANRNRLQYTTDGTTWQDFEAETGKATNMHGTINSGFDAGRYITDVAATWFIRTADFSQVDGCSDNPLFGVRIVTEFESTCYVACNPGSNYGSSGTIRFENVTFTGTESGGPATLLAEPATLSEFSYDLNAGPSESQSYSLSGNGFDPTSGVISIVPSFFYEVSLDDAIFTSETINVPYSGGSLQPTIIYVRLKAGLSAGNYDAEVIGNSGGGATPVNVICYGQVTNSALPVATGVIMPLYMSGNTPANSRVPFAFRVRIENLLPNSTYKYLNQAVSSSDNATTAGAGVLIYMDEEGNFIRNSLGNFTTPGEHGVFTTDASGSYTGWFMLEPTENERFNPGSQVFMRIRLNNGTGGNFAAHYLTVQEPVTVLKYATTISSVNGTGIYGTSGGSPKNFILLYDNESGNGRPLFASFLETTGIDFQSINYYADFYREYVSGHDGAWGGLVPNDNAAGIRLIEERSLLNGSVINNWTSADGVWGTVDTRHPAGGLDKPIFLDIKSINITSPDMISISITTINNEIIIDYPFPERYRFTVYDMCGRLISDYELTGNLHIHANLKPGIYLGCLKTPSTTISAKLIIR